jgi:hypothetical protein
MTRGAGTQLEATVATLLTLRTCKPDRPRPCSSRDVLRSTVPTLLVGGLAVTRMATVKGIPLLVTFDGVASIFSRWVADWASSGTRRNEPATQDRTIGIGSSRNGNTRRGLEG